MNTCKLCSLLPNSDLSSALLNKSSRWIAERYEIGKTTVNKHRKQCMNIYIPQSTDDSMERKEMQSVEWNGETGMLNTGFLDEELGDLDHNSILIKFGHNPNKVMIKDVVWERHEQKTDGSWKHRYSFAIIRRKEEVNNSIDAIEILNSIIQTQAQKIDKPKLGIKSTFVLDWGDWQYGKKEGGGTVALLERLENSFQLAVERIRELRNTGRNLEELVIIGGGDMIEGCVIYPQQSFGIDANRREQVRGTAAAILRGLTVLAPYFESVRVVVAPGNHGEHRITGNRTEIGDNDDLLVFEIAQLACANDPKFKHVKFEIAEKEMSVTTQIQNWIYAITHGDVYGRGSGTGVRNKVFNWFKTMAANRHPVGMADVLVTHHFHHDAMEDWGNTLWVQNPTIDGGSHYFKEYSGHDTKPGMNSWVVTENSRLQDKQVLR